MSDSVLNLPIPPNLLTIILTTSPVPSAPSSDLIKTTLASLPNSFAEVPIMITFDNFTVATDDYGRLKKGCIPQDLANQYPVYINNVRHLFGNVSCLYDDLECTVSSSLDRDVTFLILKRHNGFAFSVKIALDYVNTPYVMILQHDWIFTTPPPIFDLLSILQTEPEVQYIGFMTHRSRNYETSKGATQLYYRHIFSQSRNLRRNRLLNNDLIPCLHWLDRPHLCSVATYRRIFSTSILKRGNFIEDTFGVEYIQNITNALDKETAYEAWKKWGAWLYYPDNGNTIAVRHVHGRRNLLGAREEEKIKNRIKLNMEKQDAWSHANKHIDSTEDHTDDILSFDFESTDISTFLQ